MKNFTIIKEVCQNLSGTKWFYDSTISDAIEYFCHKNSISLLETEKNNITSQIKKVYKNGKT